VAAAGRFISRTLRATRLLARDGRIPKPLRWLAAIGLAPIPGPFDEAILLLIALPLFILYREPMLEAWRLAGASPD
jgi:hypothetical protein